jgi:hypothetical protein
MHPGQFVSQWMQEYMLGRLTTPQQIFAASRAEIPLPPTRFFGAPMDNSEIWDVPSRLQAPAHFLTNSWLKQSTRADWAHCNPRLMGWAGEFIKAAEKRLIPLYVHSALRGKAEQNALYAKGRSKARYPLSAHNIGEAVDIVHGVFHWDMTRQEWRFLHELGSRVLDRMNAGVKKEDQLHLYWGGHFKKPFDPAHWEILDYRQRLRTLPDVDPVRLTPTNLRDRYKFGALK